MSTKSLDYVKNEQAPSKLPTRTGILQRRCSNCPKKRRLLQRRPMSQNGPATVPPIVHEVLRSPGQPLDEKTRAFMEPRFGHDFSKVRVHADARAAESAHSVNAHAYTVGRHMTFGGGQYSPETNAGKRLIAHELTHIVQQSQDGFSNISGSMGISEPANADEREAEAVSDQIIAARGNKKIGMTMHSPKPALQRLGDMSKVPPELTCEVAGDSPPSETEVILFGNNASALTPQQKAQINNFAVKWHADGGSADIRVDGYASTRGTDELNWRLSCDRAQAVVSELISPSSGINGIPSGFIRTLAQGETTEFGEEAKNRRVTIFSPINPPETCSKMQPLDDGTAFSDNWGPYRMRCTPGDYTDYSCGPDISSSLGDVLNRVFNTFFNTWNTAQRFEACYAVIGYSWLFYQIVNPETAWDIVDLFLPNTKWLRRPPYYPACGFPKTGDPEDPSTCSNSVQVNSGGRKECFLAGTVNYALFGQIFRLCNLGVDSNKFNEGTINKWINRHMLWGLLDDPAPAVEWAKAGYRGYPPNMPGYQYANRSFCPCRCPLNRDLNFDWVWEPHHPRPS